MDFFSHGLWSATLAKAANLSTKKVELNPWCAAWWGVFPDVFAFALPTVWTLGGLITGTLDRSTIPSPEAGIEVQQMGPPVFKLALELYNYSHSLVLFLIIFGGIFVIRYLRNHHKLWWQLVPWVMLAWPLHILADIPTHSTSFYPTPFLWPLSSFKVNGFSWSHPVFMTANYGLLIVVTIILFFKKRKMQKNGQ